MNLMWSEMTDAAREEYKAFFLAYHDTVAASGFTGRRIKPLSVLPPALLRGFETVVLAKVESAGVNNRDYNEDIFWKGPANKLHPAAISGGLYQTSRDGHGAQILDTKLHS